MKSRARSWMREEVILAMDFYLTADDFPNMAACVPLSEYLRALPIERHLAVEGHFRNPQAVRNKFYNLQWLETDGAKGREKGGETTEKTWEEFGGDAPSVAAAAAEVRNAFADVYAVELRDGHEIPDDYEAVEGGLVLKSHYARERDRGLARRKRHQRFTATGTLACEACGFESTARYGIAGVIECHHLKPVSAMEPGETTRLSNVRLLCPNCHRIVHSRRPWLTWSELLASIQS